MKILIMMNLTPEATPEKIVPLFNQEAARSWELYKEGFFRDMNFRADQPGVVNIAECESVEKAREIVNTLPLAQAGFLSFDIIPLQYASWLENLWKH